MSKIISVILMLAVMLGLGGCITPDRNRPPSIAEIGCPASVAVGAKVAISVVSHDPNGDKVAYKVNFGDIQSEWSELLPSGVVKTFHHTYDKEGVFGVLAIASDEHLKNSGWSEKTFIEVKESNPYVWIRGLLTLKPKPSRQVASGLGFNLINPYASLPTGWISSGGKVIYTTKTVRDNEKGIVVYSTCDEPDCHKHNPYSELALVLRMKEQTSLPVGTTVVGDIGCGIKGTAPTKEEYKRQWIEVANQMDVLLIDVYPYKKPQYIGGRTPLEEMEYRHQFFAENITVPIIIIIQAHQSKSYQIKPKPMEQVKFWVDRGYGYIVYSWDDGGSPIGGVADMQDEWREANRYKKGAD